VALAGAEGLRQTAGLKNNSALHYVNQALTQPARTSVDFSGRLC
jgi:hypothetical protein